MAAPEYVPVDRQPARARLPLAAPARRVVAARPPGRGDRRRPAARRAPRQPGPRPGLRAHAGPPLRGQAHADRRASTRRTPWPGAVGVALKRASLFGRAPIVHDLTVALTIWGFLGEAAARARRAAQATSSRRCGTRTTTRSCASSSTSCPRTTLRRTPAQVTEAHRADWRSLLGEPSPRGDDRRPARRPGRHGRHAGAAPGARRGAVRPGRRRRRARWRCSWRASLRVDLDGAHLSDVTVPGAFVGEIARAARHDPDGRRDARPRRRPCGSSATPTRSSPPTRRSASSWPASWPGGCTGCSPTSATSGRSTPTPTAT